MGKTVYMMFLVGTLLPLKIFPQASDKEYTKKAGLLFGISHNQLREGSINKQVHKGEGFNIGFEREIKKGNYIRQFELSFDSDFLKSKYEEEIASYRFSTSFNYRNLFEILCCNQSSQNLYLGGKASANHSIEYFDNWDENHYYWLTTYSLGADLRFEYPVFKRNRFQFEADIPLISLVSRPPDQFMYIQSDSEFLKVIKTINEDPKISSFSRYFEINLLVKYCIQNRLKLKPAFYWKCDYLRSNLDRSAQIKILSQTLGLELYF